MRTLKTGLALFTGLLLAGLIFARPVFLAAAAKAVGMDQPCPWGPLLRFPWTLDTFNRLQGEETAGTKLLQEDAELGLQQFTTLSGRPFWIRKTGELADGQRTLAYVLAEQRWIAEAVPEHTVKRGDIVVDVGAHIGTFDHDALLRGAAKCILVEPDPLNVETIRRNFAKEIAEGRIIVVPEGAWSSNSTLEFSTGQASSGTGSFVLGEPGSTKISVPVRPLDEILAELGIEHVDFIKMDIEGAEREALRGAKNTLRRDKPVIMLDSYHLSDDAEVLPRVIQEANAQYSSGECALCSPDRHGKHEKFLPYALFFY
jgi:FkbM family methyltransferase